MAKIPPPFPFYYSDIRSYHYDRARKDYIDLAQAKRDPILCREVITQRAKTIVASLKRLHDLALVVGLIEEAARSDLAIIAVNQIIGAKDEHGPWA